MTVLVDTHLVLWAAAEPGKLSTAARAVLDSVDEQLWFSAASIWEVTVKRALGRDDFRVDPRPLRRGLLNHGWRELVITGEHAAATTELPPIHKDPFDRILVAQARVEGVVLLTSDATLAQYGQGVRLV